MIKPKETIWNGYLFRSRLEARWAVFFDTLGIKYEYEPEKFQLSNGIVYIPDFWVEEWDSYVEIKPVYPSEEEISKCRFLARGRQKKCLLIWGQPWAYKRPFVNEWGPTYDQWIHEYRIGYLNPDRDPMLSLFPQKRNAIEEIETFLDGRSPECLLVQDDFDFHCGKRDEFDIFVICRKCSALRSISLYEDSNDGVIYWQGSRFVKGSKYGYHVDVHNCRFNEEYTPDCEDHPRLIAAYTAARQARFEHRKRGIR